MSCVCNHGTDQSDRRTDDARFCDLTCTLDQLFLVSELWTGTALALPARLSWCCRTPSLKTNNKEEASSSLLHFLPFRAAAGHVRWQISAPGQTFAISHGWRFLSCLWTATADHDKGMSSPVFDLDFSTMDSNSEPKEKRPRFAQSLDEADIDVIIRDRCPANTRRTTEKWVKALDDFVREKQLSIDIESCSREELAGVLTHFYLEVWGRDGQPYQRNSLLSCRASIQRYLTSLNRDFDLYKDKTFERANAALDGELKRLKRGQLQPTRRKPPLFVSDFEALQEYLSQSRPDDAQHLTEKCWFFVTYHFSFQAREVQAGLRKTDLLLQKDQSGAEFFSLWYWLLHEELPRRFEGRRVKGLGRQDSRCATGESHQTSAQQAEPRMWPTVSAGQASCQRRRSDLVCRRTTWKKPSLQNDAEDQREGGAESALHKSLGPRHSDNPIVRCSGWSTSHHGSLRASKRAELVELLRSNQFAAGCHVVASGQPVVQLASGHFAGAKHQRHSRTKYWGVWSCTGQIFGGSVQKRASRIRGWNTHTSAGHYTSGFYWSAISWLYNHLQRQH